MGKHWSQGPFPLGKLRFCGQQSIFIGSTCPQCWLRILLRVWDVNFVAWNPWQIARMISEECSFKDLQNAFANFPTNPAPFSVLGSGLRSQSRSHRLSCVHKKGTVSERHSWFRHWEAMTKMPCFPTVTGCRSNQGNQVLRNSKDFRNLVK